MCEISIIVPVYNTERYLRQCIESILKQTFADIELLLVNDCSTDGSLKICTKYAESDNRVQVINKLTNEGVDKARFSGLKNASGRYVTFVDSDDWIEGYDTLKSMYLIAEESHVDYVEVGTQRVMDKHGWIRKKSKRNITGMIEQPELFDKYFISFFGYNILSVGIWAKLYRKSFLDKINLQPTCLRMGEDLAFNMCLFPYLKSIYLMDSIGYNYRFGGMTSKYNPYLYPDLKHLFFMKEELIEKYDYHKATDFIRIELKNVLSSDICQRIIYNNNKNDTINFIAQELEDNVWERATITLDHPDYMTDPFVLSIRKKDANKIYDICLAKVRKDKNLRFIKRIASWLLTHGI